MNYKSLFTFITLAALSGSSLVAKSYRLSSPNGALTAVVDCGDSLTYAVLAHGDTILAPSAIAMQLGNGTTWGVAPRVEKVSKKSVNSSVNTSLWQAASIADKYNSLSLKMKGNWSVEFRAYNDGVAYRFVSDIKKPFEVINEKAEFRFPANRPVTIPYVNMGQDGNWGSQFYNSHENHYTVTTLTETNPGRIAFTPVAVTASDSVLVAITESDLNNYPGMYLYNPDGGSHLIGKYAPYPTRVAPGGYNGVQEIVHESAPYIARVDGPRSFPWRVIVVGNDATLASTNLVYLLAEPSRVADTSWIKPGKVAWEWWNDWNITGVDFVAGVNTDTYKHYIDFASRNGIEYVILDEGWSVGLDLTKVNPAVNLDEILSYAKQKNVGIILWAGFCAIAPDFENLCRLYASKGVKGFKIDFEDRDDQLMTAFNHRAAEIAARYNLVLDIHGSYKPAGINRTWPNVLNVEGVKGMEYLKFNSLDKFDIVEEVNYLPYLRQIAGPMDFTQGAMDNGTRDNYHKSYNRPMSQGTRCQQLALYTILMSPLNMLCDSPSNYDREQDCTEYIAQIPTAWDETKVLDGKMGDYVVMARRHGNDWYIAGTTDWTPRDLTVDLTPLGLDDKNYTITTFRDGANAHRNATDYRRSVTSGRVPATMQFHLAPGGGFAVKLTPAN